MDSVNSTIPAAHSIQSTPVVRKPRVLFLDVLRGVAVAFVLLQHLTEDVSQPILWWGHRWINFGRLGVALFFLISGFVIPYSLERANSLKVFWVSRVFRLYPIYWFSLLVVIAFHFAGNHVMEREYVERFWRTMAVNVFLIQEFVHVPHAMGLYWTLTLEMVFYVIFSVLFGLNVNQKSTLWCWCSCAFLALLGCVDKFGHHKMPTSHVALIVFATFGTVLFRYYSGLVSGRQLALLAAGVTVATGIAFGLGFRSPLARTGLEEWTSVSMFNSYMGAVVVFAIIFSYRANDFAFAFRWLGTISYSIYLLHYPIWILWEGVPHHGWISGPLWEMGIIGSAILVSSVTYLAVEKPAVELGKKFLHRPKPATELGTPVTTQTPTGPVRVITAA